MTAGKLKQINIAGIGSVDVSWNGSTASFDKQYYIKDHLGSVRLAKNLAGTVVSARNYSAFGETIQESVTSGKNKRYRFTGKERDDETNMDYFGARYYDAEVGRWNTVDPLYEKYPGWSPYNYCMNRPYNIIDPDGCGVFITGTSSENVTQELSKKYGLEFRCDPGTGLLSAYDSDGNRINSTDGYSGATEDFLSMIFDTKTEAELACTDKDYEGEIQILVGGIEGSHEIKELGVSWSKNYFNISHSKKAAELASTQFKQNWGTPGNDAAHEIFEAYFVGKNYPNYHHKDPKDPEYQVAHNYALSKTFNNPNLALVYNGFGGGGIRDVTTWVYFTIYR